MIFGNYRLLEELVYNLCDNAIRYNKPGGEVCVTIAQKDKRWSCVCPTPALAFHRNQDRIFERFYRVDKGRSRKQGGTGLGLSIVKHIVNFYHGSVKVESEVGKGSTFTVKLQIAEAK